MTQKEKDHAWVHFCFSYVDFLHNIQVFFGVVQFYLQILEVRLLALSSPA